MTPQDAYKEAQTLSLVSIANGDTPENVEAAAKQIGYLVMHFPSILVAPQQPQQNRSSAPAQRDNGSRAPDSRGNGRGQPPERDEYDQSERRSGYQSRGGSGGGGSKEKKYMLFDHQGVVRETANAVCFKINGLDIWIPRSNIKEFNKTTMTITEWIAREKELIS
jgi:hypothetical protein